LAIIGQSRTTGGMTASQLSAVIRR
jgi:hypothetical protein